MLTRTKPLRSSSGALRQQKASIPARNVARPAMPSLLAPFKQAISRWQRPAKVNELLKLVSGSVTPARSEVLRIVEELSSDLKGARVSDPDLISATWEMVYWSEPVSCQHDKSQKGVAWTVAAGDSALVQPSPPPTQCASTHEAYQQGLQLGNAAIRAL